MPPYEWSARVYDELYQSIKDYRAEAERIHELISWHSLRPVHTLLNVACGTGLHDEHLRERYELEGLDISADQLEFARRRLPGQPLHLGDMRHFELGRQFDAVTCLFSSIGYMTTVPDLHQAVANQARHLAPGGVLIVEPWLHPEGFKNDGKPRLNFVSRDDYTLARISRVRRDGTITYLTMDHFLKVGDELEHHIEEHVTVMYTIEEYTAAFRSAGLDVFHDPQGLIGRGLFIGRRPL